MDPHQSIGNSSTGETAALPTAAAPPAIANPEEVAATLIAMIDQFETTIPNFQHHDKNDIRRVTGVARFANELVVPTIATTTSFGPAGARNLFNIEDARMALRSRDAFHPVIQRLSALRDGLEFTVNSALAEAGGQALDVYSWAKTYAKRPDAAALHPYVGSMTQVVRKVLNRRKVSAPATPPAPSAPPAASSQLPPGSHGFLGSNVVRSEPAGEDEYPAAFNEALDRAAAE